MNENQRLKAMATCDRILATNVRLQSIADDIKRGAEELRASLPQSTKSEAQRALERLVRKGADGRWYTTQHGDVDVTIIVGGAL
jgi:hypothetical protein